jgi:hypothetical protein
LIIIQSYERKWAVLSFIDWISHRNGRDVFLNSISLYEQHFSMDNREEKQSSWFIGSLFGWNSSVAIIELIRRYFSPAFTELATVLFERRFIAILPFLARLLVHVPQPSLVPSLLHLLVNVRSCPSSRSSSSSKALKTAVMVRMMTMQGVKNDDLLLSGLLVLHLSKMIEKDEFRTIHSSLSVRERRSIDSLVDSFVPFGISLFESVFVLIGSQVFYSEYCSENLENATPQSVARTIRFFSIEWQIQSIVHLIKNNIRT